jgi:hypothetical protein
LEANKMLWTNSGKIQPRPKPKIEFIDELPSQEAHTAKRA